MTGPTGDDRNTRQRGAEAEDFVAKHLEKQGFTIADRNFTVRGGELDIVARKEDLLLFVEVRSWKKRFWDGGTPAETIHPQKIRHIVKTALYWAQTHGVRLQRTRIRFDVAALVGAEGKYEMDYLEDAFPAVGLR